MSNKIIFDDTEVTGWSVAQTTSHGALIDPHTVYATHVTCTHSSRVPDDAEKMSDRLEEERWSWFVDDIESKNGIHICFECGEPVPDHIQALVVLRTPVEVMGRGDE